MASRPINSNRQMKDPSALTQYEQKLWELASRGLKPKQIAVELGGTANNVSISGRLQIIREKLEAR